jgi:hypothetical protein
MAKASLTLPNGTVVEVNGSPEEIAKLMELYSGAKSDNNRHIRTKNAAKKGSNINLKKGPFNFIQELKNDGFFKEKRSLQQVQKKLEEKGHIYAMTSMSAPLLRLVRKKILGRVQDKGIWCYVNR